MYCHTRPCFRLPHAARVPIASVVLLLYCHTRPGFRLPALCCYCIAKRGLSQSILAFIAISSTQLHSFHCACDWLAHRTIVIEY